MFRCDLMFGETVEEVREIAEPFIREALARGTDYTDFDSVWLDILDDSAQLWIVSRNEVIEGICVTQIIMQNNEKLLFVIATAGKQLAAWANELDNTLTTFGREQNCRAIESVSRKGMKPLLSPLGFKVKRDLVILRKELTVFH